MNGLTIPFGFACFLLCQTVGAIWWASSVNTEVDRLVAGEDAYETHKDDYIQRLSIIETKVENNYRILLKLEDKIEEIK
tara:strand:+ start:2807 stop:3043 length:237 start_codon:yes stop_codon:yes gene_type:complete